MKHNQPATTRRHKPRANPASIWAAVAALACLVLAMPASAQPTLDELLNLDTAPADPGAAESNDEASRPEDESAGEDADNAIDLTDAVEDRLEGHGTGDLLKEAVRGMDTAASRLAKSNDAGLDTQRTQQDVIDKLDQLIAAAKKQQGGGGSSSSGGQPSEQQSGNQGNQGRQPGQQAGQGQGQGQAQPAGQGENSGDFSPGSPQAADARTAIEEYREEWGQLPPRLRGELMEGLQEHFSPLYRSLTEAYYRELAQEAQ